MAKNFKSGLDLKTVERRERVLETHSHLAFRLHQTASRPGDHLEQ
jgi:hypothetical protein